ncbi:MAG: Uma2 family endonuclease [Gammaproteobacteria bacterium]
MSTLPRPHRWTREQYERVVRLGGFDPDRRLELIDGEIVEMAPQNEPHAVALCLLHDALRRAYGDGHVIRIQSPLAVDAGSAPEPDVAIVPGRPRDFLTGHPGHAVLLVEIADTTLAYDRSTKRLLYARNGIPEYWLVNLVQGVVEVYSNPQGADYLEHRIAKKGETLMPSGASRAVAVADLLP